MRFWNKAYVTSHYPGAFASRHNKTGRLTKKWHVFVPQIVDITGVVTWHFVAKSATVAWMMAADAVEQKIRR